MKFSTREDIAAPIDRVYSAASDFAAFEAQMRRRGIEIARTDATAYATAGARWQARFFWRSRPHDVVAELIEITEGQGYAIESTSGGVICISVMDLVALSQNRTRMLVSLELRPTTLSSRLLLHSLKLAKSNLDRKFKTRVTELAKRIEG